MNFARRIALPALALWASLAVPFASAAEPTNALAAYKLQAAPQSDLPARRATLDAEFTTSIETLAKEREKEKDSAAATALRSWIAPLDPALIAVPQLPDEVAPKPAADSWEAGFVAIRSGYGDKLLALAREAQQGQDYALARTLLLEAARQKPDDEAIRKLLGQSLYRGRWRTTYEREQIEAGLVWDDRWGWLRSTHLPEYEQGKRFVEVEGRNGRPKGAWVSAEQEAELRRDIEKGWAVETEHYRVVTNHSQAEAVRLAKRLEELHHVWREAFLSFWATPDQLRTMFDKPLKTQATRHEVICFRDRAEYVRTLRGQSGGDVSISTGVYFNATEKAYFYVDDENDDGTLLHEASHQLFSETNKSIRAAGRRPNFWENRKANFWIVEGIACFMETLRAENGRWIVGGTDTNRFRYAQYRTVNQGWFEPIANLTGYSMNELVRQPEVASLYSESAALVVYLMREPRRRVAMDAYLVDVYLGQ
ncbi:MAG TPA: hypothetical protein VGE52_02475, partial [Pirellulales bacterium]